MPRWEISPTGGRIVKRTYAILGILGAGWLGNVLMALTLYYTLFPIHGVPSPTPTSVTSSAGTTVPSADHHALLISLLFLSSGLFAFLPAWLLSYGPLGPKETRRQETEDSKVLIRIQSPSGGRVPLFKIVIGFAYPPPTLVQVLILAGPVNDRRWFPQPDAEISRYGWTAKCRFGDASAPETGWGFDFCAVIPRTRINDAVKDIPADAIVSEIIHVSLDRRLPDEDFR